MGDGRDKLKARSSVILKAMNAAPWEWNIQTGECVFSDRWAEIVGYNLDELEQKINTWERLVHPDDLKKVNRIFTKLFNKEIDYYALELRMKHKVGKYIWVFDSGQVIEWTEDDQPLIAVGTHLDITSRKTLHMALEENERNLREIVENTKDIIYRLDLEGDFTFISPAWMERLGYLIYKSIGASFTNFVHEDDVEKVTQFFQDVKSFNGNKESIRFRFKTRGGKTYHYETTASTITEFDTIVGYVGIARDITEIINKEKEIEYLSYHDQLTKFYNRHYLEKVKNEINSEENFPLCVISIDLNNLKYVNDTFGHLVGDEVIKAAAETIKKTVPNTKYLFRTGGDEFLIFLPHTTDDEAYALCAKMDEAVKVRSRDDFPISLAYGYHMKVHPSKSLYEDIRVADNFMYRNKRKYHKKRYTD